MSESTASLTFGPTSMAEIFDIAALQRLACEVGDKAFPLTFTHKYRGLLETRLGRIRRALHSSDSATALDAVLSLKVASTIVGTHELAALALVIEADLREHDFTSARARATELDPAALRAAQALDSYLHG